MASEPLRKVLESMKVPREATGHDGVYVLGCLERRVTIYSQQVRALNLAAALFDDKRLAPGDEVLVIGAGVAGLTCAAGLHRLGATVTVLEKAKDILPILRGKPKRWVHPGIYEWPFEDATRDRAGLPLLDWRAGMVEDVEQQLRAGWDATGLSVTPGVRDITIGADRVTWNPGIRSSRATVIVLAVGFGLESNDYQGDRSYWENDDLDDIRVHDRPTTWLLSGSGDGALTDLFRLCIRDFRHDTMVARFTQHARTHEIVAAIRRIEDDDVLQRDPSRLHDAYANLEAPWLDADIDLRTDTQVKLNAIDANFLTAGASVLNRFITAQLARLGAFDFLPGRITKDDVRRVGETFEVTIDGRKHAFDRIVRRHGPVRALEHGFPRVWAALEAQRQARATMPSTTDHSRTRAWPAGRFAPKSEAGHDARSVRLARVLDRVAYWNTIRDAGDHPTEHHYFMIDGAPHQGVEYLLGRIHDSFNRSGHVAHDIVEAFSQLDIGRAVVAEDWQRHVLAALGAATLDDALRTRTRPLLLILRDAHGPLRAQGVPAAAIAGLAEFLQQRLPDALERAKPPQPIRVLVPIEYPTHRDDDELAKRVRAAMGRAPGFVYKPTHALGWPPFEDIWGSLENEYPDRLTPALRRDCTQEHRRIGQSTESFEELAKALAHILTEHGLEA